MNNLTLGSLFDGSGGFPLGGLISGIVYCTQSEIPFSKIDEVGAGMYKGGKITRAERHAIK